jgi:hypothetical protein
MCRHTTKTNKATLPSVALTLIDEVLAEMTSLDLVIQGLPECNGKEVQLRLQARGGLTLDWSFQLKQGAMIGSLWAGDGQHGPKHVRG